MAAGKRISGSSSKAGAEAGADGPGTRSGDPETRARQICLRLLTAEPRTRAQLAQALQRRGAPDDAAEAGPRGVDSEEIREAVAPLDPEQEAATARRLVEHKLASTRGQSPEARA